MRNLEFLELKRSKKTFYLQHHFQGLTRPQSFEANHQETCFKHHVTHNVWRSSAAKACSHCSASCDWWEIPKEQLDTFVHINLEDSSENQYTKSSWYLVAESSNFDVAPKICTLGTSHAVIALLWAIKLLPKPGLTKVERDMTLVDIDGYCPDSLEGKLKKKTANS